MPTEAFEEPMIGVRDYPTEADARHVGALLVEHGIGATIEPVPAEELPEDGPTAGYRVLVLSHELVRAEETLGLREPDQRVPRDPDEPLKLDKKRPPWKLFAVIWLVAMVTVPAGAFVVTYFFVSR